MRLVTWNCCKGPYSIKVPLLDPLCADIAVVQECAKPKVESETCLWVGTNLRQGIAIQTANGYRVRALPSLADVPEFVIPVEISGPQNFTLLAVWSKGGQKYRYVMGVVKAVQTYRTLFDSPTVLIGDLNSNAIWDTNTQQGSITQP